MALHWDGKLTTDRLGNKYEALTVIASGSPDYTDGKLLGVQQIENATGKVQAEATFEMVELWELKDHVKALVFDTTASNSGWKSGAAKYLEDMIGSKLFYCACRHHILERVMAGVWGSLFGTTTTGPENPHFKRLKSTWQSIDKSKDFKLLNITNDWLVGRKTAVVKSIQEELMRSSTQKHPPLRADYKESAENALAILGDTPTNYHHRKPGATHSARWMGQLIYSQKMFMWSEQLGYNKKLITLVERVNQFTALFYTANWLQASSGVDAPINDLKLFHDMIDYKAFDKQVAEAALKKLTNHRWYLTEELVVFALFSDNPVMTEDSKRRMADRLLSCPRPEEFRLGRSIFKDILRETLLHDLIGPESWFLFITLGVNYDWLSTPVKEWKLHHDFAVAKEFAHTVKVVNDAAERGVKLSTECATIITDNPIQRRALMQAIEDHRKSFPDFKKSTLQKN